MTKRGRLAAAMIAVILVAAALSEVLNSTSNMNTSAPGIKAGWTAGKTMLIYVFGDLPAGTTFTGCHYELSAGNGTIISFTGITGTGSSNALSVQTGGVTYTLFLHGTSELITSGDFASVETSAEVIPGAEYRLTVLSPTNQSLGSYTIVA